MALKAAARRYVKDGTKNHRLLQCGYDDNESLVCVRERARLLEVPIGDCFLSEAISQDRAFVALYYSSACQIDLGLSFDLSKKEAILWQIDMATDSQKNYNFF